MSFQRCSYNLHDRQPSSIDEGTPRKRTCSEVEAEEDCSSTNRIFPIISSAPVNKRFRSEPDILEKNDQTPLVKCLLPETLLQVFQYLPLPDRKNVRLACKLWNEQCTRTPIIAREKLVFRAGCRIVDVVKILSKCNFVRMNLEFHTPLVNGLPADTWKKFGHRVHEINFYSGCSLGHETLKITILNCANLTSLKLYYDWDPDTSFKILDFLIDEGVKRSRLETFATFHKSRRRLIPCPDILEKIFVIFPCVKRFCVKNLYDNRVCDFEGMPLLLKLPTQLESLEYNVLTRDSWLEEPMMPAWESRLVRFEATLAKPKNAVRIFQFFATQKDLKSVSLWLTDDYEDFEFTKKLMFHVLEQCSKLRKFRINHLHYHQYLLLTTEEYDQFLVLISKLRCLNIDFSFEIKSPPTSMPIKNFALNAVSASGSYVNPLLCDLWHMLMHCSRLKHLEITIAAADPLLQRIFENMLDLKTLLLVCDRRCTNFGFTGQRSTRDGGYSIKRLQKLEHLEILFDCSHRRLDIMVISREFQFPRLKHLKLIVKSLNVDVRQITSNTPALETLILGWSFPPAEGGFSVEQTMEFCKYLKQLKYIRIPIVFEKRDLSTMRPLFEACPSLRYVRVYHPWGDLYRIVLSHNPFSKEVRLDHSKRPFCIPGRKRFAMFNSNL